MTADATCADDDSYLAKLNLGSADTTPPYLDYLRKPVANEDVVLDPNGSRAASGWTNSSTLKTILDDSEINLQVSTKDGVVTTRAAPMWRRARST